MRSSVVLTKFTFARKMHGVTATVYDDGFEVHASETYAALIFRGILYLYHPSIST